MEERKRVNLFQEPMDTRVTQAVLVHLGSVAHRVIVPTVPLLDSHPAISRQLKSQHSLRLTRNSDVIEYNMIKSDTIISSIEFTPDFASLTHI